MFADAILVHVFFIVSFFTSFVSNPLSGLVFLNSMAEPSAPETRAQKKERKKKEWQNRTEGSLVSDTTLEGQSSEAAVVTTGSAGSANQEMTSGMQRARECMHRHRERDVCM